jgi:aspartyl-tRNA(Asn)/glutamyl-tRNA(Gln) amidotransferase subunit B
VDSGEISSKIAKDVFADMLETQRTPQQIIADKGLVQVQDTGLIEDMLRKLVNENPDNVAAYRGGKQNVIGWFVGQVMKATGGRANPKLVNDVLRKLLDEAK